MRAQLQAILLGFTVGFLGWWLLLIVGSGPWLEVGPVLLGVTAALAARRVIGLFGGLAGFFAWYAIAVAGGSHLDGEWQGPAFMFTLLIASGFAGGAVLLWLRDSRAARARAA